MIPASPGRVDFKNEKNIIFIKFYIIIYKYQSLIILFG
jgi:hypothetical protein